MNKHLKLGRKYGVLPYQGIQEFIAAGIVSGAKEENINPASLDLSLSDEMYQVAGIFLPRLGETISDVLKEVKHFPHNFQDPLERDVVYLARLNESLHLPDEWQGYCNPKSSTGRNDVHVRVLADGVPRYDTIPGGYDGSLWVTIVPHSYPVKIAKGERLTQVRFLNCDTKFDEDDLREVLSKDNLIFNSHGMPIPYESIKVRDGDGSVILRVDLDQVIAGYECIKPNEVIDLSKKNFYRPGDFFREVKRMGESIYLKKDGFYILSTKEAVRVPPSLALEVTPMDERSGEFRSHYAGFFDPGWGYGKQGEGKGRPATLEVRPFENLLLRNKQAIAKVKFEWLIEPPTVIYDSMGTSNYTAQSNAKLSKHFKGES